MIALVLADGRETFFRASDMNVRRISAGVGELSRSSNGWKYQSATNESFSFDEFGQLNAWSSRNGTSLQLTRSGNQVTVIDNLGNVLTFSDDAHFQPVTMSARGISITYTYNANKRLTTVARTLNGQTSRRIYHYEDSRNTALLTGVTDERRVRRATWSYDDHGRVISGFQAQGANRINVAYSADTTKVTNELGKVTEYSFDSVRGVKLITAVKGEPSTNCISSNSSYTYNSLGLVTSKTDHKGNVTTYGYNERGLEVSRTEAFGTPEARTITTAWHPTLFLPVTVTEPNQITHYTYDTQGRQLSQTIIER
ncbi:hypothetical protein DM292_07460 [Stutzerimonas frequens]|nr:hypothetical protein DM292_07460 [Stutzerimonas frequens]